MKRKKFFKKFKIFWKYFGYVLLVFSILSILSWATQIDDYYECIGSDLVNDSQCAKVFILQEPHVEQAKAIAEGCESENVRDCFENAGFVIYEDYFGEFKK